jgi:dihydroxy-acid dehydratase
MVVGHVAPEAYDGGAIALIEEGGLDHDRRAQAAVAAQRRTTTVLARRRAQWKRPAPKYTRGVLAKYMQLVSTASRGAVTDGGNA